MMMKNTVLHSTLVLKLVFIVFFTMVSCHKKEQQNSSSKKDNSNQLQPVKTKNQTKKSNPLVTLTDANLESELTAFGNENRESQILMKTPKGNLKIQLYTNTPLHRANFIRLIKNNFYKGTVFYRVINNFMIQGGDSDDWERQSIKQKMGCYTLPSEIRKENIHKKGALSMAREYENNPEKRSVAFEFFIVQGIKYSEGELIGIQQQYHITLSAEHKEIYNTMGGTPHLDGQHTVFGQVIDGFEVIDSIAASAVDAGKWPIQDITIAFEIIK
jgi:peptidyl-prolyl cis-trans isomerase A (cyclophilin A)